MTEAFQYISDNGGIDTEFSYPYRATNGNCQFNSRYVGATDKVSISFLLFLFEVALFFSRVMLKFNQEVNLIYKLLFLELVLFRLLLMLQTHYFNSILRVFTMDLPVHQLNWITPF
jgi:hypothetical protein